MAVLRLALASLTAGFSCELAIRNLWAAIGAGLVMVAVNERQLIREARRAIERQSAGMMPAERSDIEKPA